MAIKCCLGCKPPKRNPTCHGHCPEYIAEKEQDQIEKSKEYIRQKVSHDIYQQRADKVAKVRRRHGRK